MSAQEELEKLHADIDATAFLANRVGDHRYSAQLREWADRLAAIREGLGKAQVEPFGYLHMTPGRMPDFHFKAVAHEEMMPVYIRPQADSAQALVEARNITKIERLGDQTVSVTLASCRAASALEKALTDYHAQVTGEALAAHKSEVKG